MAIARQYRRGTTAEHSSFTGLAGEVTVDTDKDTLVVHDGSTAGGFPLLREDLSNVPNNSISTSKIESGTAGRLLAYNASGVLSTIPLGSTGQNLVVDAASNFYQYSTSGGVIKTTHFQDATTNISVSSGSGTSLISFTFTKSRSDTNLVFNGFTPRSGQNSYHSGCYIQFACGGSSWRSYISLVEMSPSDGMGDDGIYGENIYNGYLSASDLGNNSGTVTVTMGWASRDGSSQAPSNFWNPYQRSARIQGYTTNLTVLEVEPSVSTHTT